MPSALDERQGKLLGQRLSETLFGSLKVERLHGQRFETIRQAKDETIAWLLWYNQPRMHSTLCYPSPIEFENQWEKYSDESCGMMMVATEAGVEMPVHGKHGKNDQTVFPPFPQTLEIDKADFHIPAPRLLRG